MTAAIAQTTWVSLSANTAFTNGQPIKFSAINHQVLGSAAIVYSTSTGLFTVQKPGRVFFKVFIRQQVTTVANLGASIWINGLQQTQAGFAVRSTTGIYQGTSILDSVFGEFYVSPGDTFYGSLLNTSLTAGFSGTQATVVWTPLDPSQSAVSLSGQPFQCVLNTSYPVTTGANVIFNQITVTNPNFSYNTSTGVFTAITDGLYWLGCTVGVSNYLSNWSAFFVLLVNGVAARQWFGSNYGNATPAGLYNFNLAEPVQLLAGNTFSYQLNGASSPCNYVGTAASTQFNGFLMQKGT